MHLTSSSVLAPAPVDAPLDGLLHIADTFDPPYTRTLCGQAIPNGQPPRYVGDECVVCVELEIALAKAEYEARHAF